MKYWPLILKNLGRNRLRTLLTGAAIALSIALVSLLLTMPAGFDAVLEAVSKNTRIVVHSKAGLVYPLPASYQRKVLAVPGVVDASSYIWFGGVYDDDKGVTFPNFAVDPERIAVVYEDYDVAPEVWKEFQTRRDAALVGGQTAERYGWQIGDRIALKSTMAPLELSFRIVGTLPGQNPVLWFQREYYEQALEARGGTLDDIGMLWVRVDDPHRVEGVMREIDEMFQNSESETASETEKSFTTSFFGVLEGFITVILVVTALVALCIVFIAANTASMSVRERQGELAVMKALGFRPRTLFGILLIEAIVLSTIAGAAGALASLGLTGALRGAAELGPSASVMIGGFVVTNAILIQVIFLSLFVGMISGVVPSLGAARRSVVVTLREVF